MLENSLIGMLTAGGFVAVLLTILGAGQAYCGKKFFVEEDPRIDVVNNLLPQANCGACGKPGCRGFAEAVVKGETNLGGCTVSSLEKKQEIAEYLGVVVVETEKIVAFLSCQGDINVAPNKADFSRIHTCREAVGGKECSWGCLGLGDCVIACKFEALKMSDKGLPLVDREKCIACNECVLVCPKNLFSLIPESRTLLVACKNLQLGQPAKEVCKVACTGCGNCVTDAPKGLIKIVDGLAVIDYESGLSLLETATKNCPTGAIIYKK